MNIVYKNKELQLKKINFSGNGIVKIVVFAENVQELFKQVTILIVNNVNKVIINFVYNNNLLMAKSETFVNSA
jgi:hypothetical protein